MARKFMESDIRKILYFIKPYPYYILGIFFLILMAALFEGLGIVTLFGLLGAVLNQGSSLAAGSGISKSVFKFISMIPAGDKVVTISVFMVIVIVAKSLIVFARQTLTNYAGFKIWYEIQEKVFLKYLDADYQFFQDNKQGQLIFLAYSAPSYMGCLLQYAGEGLAYLLQAVVIGVVLFFISPLLSVITFLFGGLFYFFTSLVAKRISYNLGKGRKKACEDQNILLAEFISGIKQIKVYLSGKRWLEKYVTAMKDYFRFALRDRIWHEIPAGMAEVFAAMMLCSFIIFFRIFDPQAFAGRLSLLGAFAYGFYRLMPNLRQIGILRMAIAGNLPMVKVIHEIVTEDVAKIKDGGIGLNGFEKNIIFEKVDFSYPGRPRVLESIDLEIRKGQILAVIGPSGSGKSTIVNLLLKIFVPAKGRILIDGVDLNDIRSESWLGRIGYVSQETFIFNATIEDNIVFGRPYDAGRVAEVAKLANAHSFIESFPDGYKTIVGDRGSKLSGGQRQRIAIARAMYNNPQLLVLDEATSALDTVQETRIQETIRDIAHKTTVLLIAHRFSTILDANWIVVLDRGKVVERGSHESLNKNRELYWNLYKDEARHAGSSWAKTE